MHPVRSTVGSLIRKATPKPIRKVQYARHPIGTATTHVGRKVRRSFFIYAPMPTMGLLRGWPPREPKNGNVLG
jgi:hypothetical protein